jgi:hypothetical protein
MRFTLTGISGRLAIVLTWESGGKVDTDKGVLQALRSSAAGMSGKLLGPTPGEATNAREYFTNPEAFLELFALTFPSVHYTLVGDDPRERPPGRNIVF